MPMSGMAVKKIISYIRRNPDIFIFLAIVTAALILRLYHLDLRTFHHDEAAVGSFTYKLFSRGTYEYNPIFHGPFIYFLTAFVFQILGDSEFTARLLPALTGVGMVLLAYPLRRHLGRPGWLFAAAFLAFSPSFLYYSRFFRNDIFITFFTLAAVICAVKYLEKGNSHSRLIYLCAGSASLGFSATAKENTYVTMALFAFPVGLFVLYRIVHSLRRRHLLHEAVEFLERNAFRLMLDTMVLLVSFLAIFTLFYSYFFSDLEAVKFAPVNAFTHWYEMHDVERIGGPPYYYIPQLLLYELPVVIFAFVGSVEYIERFIKRKGSPLMVFIVYWLAASLAAYSYIGEKVPWLILHPLLPAILVASAYLGESLPTLRQRPRWAEAAFVLILVLSSSFFMYTSYNLNYRNYADPAEPLIQASQPPQKFQVFLDTLHQTAEQHDGYYTRMQITDNEMDTQFLWHLRHYSKVSWHVNLEDDPVLDAPIVVAHDEDADYVEMAVGNEYQRLDSAKMAWYWFKPDDINYWFIMHRWLDRPQSEYGVVLFYR